MTKDAILFCIRYELMKEFKKRGLHIKYQKEIEEWFIYLDQVEFGKRLEKQMLEEIDRFISERKSIEELLKEIFEEPEWVIEIEEGLMEKYPRLQISKNMILGYA